MSLPTDPREKVRELSIVAYIVMLALLMPLTLFLIKQEQEVRTRAGEPLTAMSGRTDLIAQNTLITPSFFPLAPCPSCINPSVSPVISGQVVPSGAVAYPTAIKTNPVPSTANTVPVPCDAADTSISYADNKRPHGKKHHKKHSGAVSGGMEELIKFLTELLNKLLQMLGGGQINMPTDPNPVPSTTVPNPSGAVPAPCVTSTIPSIAQQPSNTPGTSIVPSISVISSVVPSQGAGAGKTADVNITFYGSYDNDPAGSLAISNPVKHQEAGGTGTYEDPLTFASPAGSGAYTYGQIIYVPRVQKYFIKEDECAVSWTAPNGCGAVTMVDLYVGNPSDAEAVVECENSLTPGGNSQIILDPPANLTVDPNPIWNQSTSTCMKPH